MCRGHSCYAGRHFCDHFDACTQAEEYIDERHRHRYEVNPDMVEELEAAGLRYVDTIRGFIDT